MKRIIANALLGTAVALTAAVLGACGAEDEPAQRLMPCMSFEEDSWMDDATYVHLSDKDQATVDTACFFSTLGYEEPVTLAELRILEADYHEDEACAFDIERYDTPECVARLEHSLTIEEVRKGMTE